MGDGATHLMDNVLPKVPYRHIVVSLPFEVRGLLAFRGRLLNAVARLVDDTVMRWQRERMQRGDMRVGGVSVVQRAGGSLNAHPHVPLLVADGGWRGEADGSLSFLEASPPTLEEAGSLAKAIAKRLLEMLRRRKLLRKGEDPAEDLRSASTLEGCIQLALSLGRREEEGSAWARAPGEPEPPEPSRRGLRAVSQGVNVHVGEVVAANDRRRLERLVRYLLRPPLSLKPLVSTGRRGAGVSARASRPKGSHGHGAFALRSCSDGWPRSCLRLGSP